jgi:Pentapeptide repeats (8 copies)
MPALDGALIASLTAIVTALAAVAGLILSLRTATEVRRRELKESALRQFQETSTNLASPSPALRSVGVENMARYLLRSEFRETALRVLIYNFLLEPDWHLRSRLFDLLVSNARHLPELLPTLVRVNRETWRLIIGASTNDAEQSATSRLPQLAATLELTKQAITAVLREPPDRAAHRSPVPVVDLSGIRLDGADLSGAHLVDTNLRWASLSFCNLHRAELRNCDLSFAVLIGAYMENSLIAPSHLDHAVLCGARFADTQLLLPENESISAYFSSLDGLSFSSEQSQHAAQDGILDFGGGGRFSVCLERELTWPGLWITRPEGDLTAIWESQVDRRTITAMMQREDDGGSFRRYDSSDQNDGSYRIDRRIQLDHLERYQVITGRRTLCKEPDGLPREWHGIWWDFGGRTAAEARSASESR